MISAVFFLSHACFIINNRQSIDCSKCGCYFRLNEHWGDLILWVISNCAANGVVMGSSVFPQCFMQYIFTFYIFYRKCAVQIQGLEQKQKNDQLKLSTVCTNCTYIYPKIGNHPYMYTYIVAIHKNSLHSRWQELLEQPSKQQKLITTTPATTETKSVQKFMFVSIFQ